MGEQTGKITEVVGRVTGDREVEAKGRVEQEVADPAEPDPRASQAYARLHPLVTTTLRMQSSAMRRASVTGMGPRPGISQRSPAMVWPRSNAS
jgi:hypothetical protein